MTSYNFTYKGRTTIVTDIDSTTGKSVKETEHFTKYPIEVFLAEVLFANVSKWFGENFELPDCDALVNMSDEELLSHFKQID